MNKTPAEIGNSKFGIRKSASFLFSARGAALALTLALSGAAQAQSLYESFDYIVPGNVGGTSSGASATLNNNWATHSTSNTNPISLVSGSLSYVGLPNSLGNRINIPGNNTLVPRDINRASGVTGSPSVAYFSFLLNVLNNTQLGTAHGDNGYFISFGSGTGSSSGSLMGRVSIRSVNTGANFRIGVQNTTGGTPNYTDVTTDLNFAQT